MPMEISMSQQAKAVETRILDAGGRRIASVEGPNHSALDFYTLNGRVIICQDFKEHSGVEVYLSHIGNTMKSIYAALEEIVKS